MNLVMLGRPGSGKGTQSKRIESAFGLFHLSTGDMLRSAIQQDTPLGRQIAAKINQGDFVTDELAIFLVEQSLAQSPTSNVIFDGIPRNVVQARLLSELLYKRSRRIHLVIELSVDDQTVRSRLLKRADQEKRIDDTIETITHRLSIYQSETAPLIDHYHQEGGLVTVDGSGTPDEVFESIQMKLGEMAYF